MIQLVDIETNRQSVCMADDIDDHKIVLQISNDLTINNYISILNQKNFFARVSGNNVAWTLTINNLEIATYYTKSSNIIIIDEEYWRTNKHHFPHFFKYYSPIEKRLYQIEDYRVPKNRGLIKEIKHIKKIK